MLVVDGTFCEYPRSRRFVIGGSFFGIKKNKKINELTTLFLDNSLV